MALTRAEWEELYTICKEIMDILNAPIHEHIRKEMIRGRIDLIQKRIESVIGQMK